MAQSSAFEEPSAAAFLHQNYLEFFTDVGELAEAASYLSDASFMSEAYRRRPWQVQLLPYVASLAGRGVVSCNQHPAPSRQQVFRKPHLYTVEREITERTQRLANKFQSAAAGSSGRLHGTAELAVDLIPHLRLALQHAAGRSVSSPCLSDEQWDTMVQLTTFAGRLPPQRPRAAGPSTFGVPHDTGGAGTLPTNRQTHLDDEIEED